jgi:hypothetical protein
MPGGGSGLGLDGGLLCFAAWGRRGYGLLLGGDAVGVLPGAHSVGSLPGWGPLLELAAWGRLTLHRDADTTMYHGVVFVFF